MKLLPQIIFSIQRLLLPALDEEVGPLSELHNRFVAICHVANLEMFMSPFDWVGFGRKPCSRLKIAQAFLAKSLWKLPTTRALIDRLQSDTILRRLCGWEDGPNEVPDESTFSRAFAHFARLGLGNHVHKSLISTHLGDELIWTSSTDATSIEARERPASNSASAATDASANALEAGNAPAKPVKLLVLPPDFHFQNPIIMRAPASASPAPSDSPVVKAKGIRKKRGRPRKGEELPAPEPKRLERHLHNTLEDNILDMPEVLCSHGCKKNAKGFTNHWVGYKLHLSTGDGDIPLAAYLSGATLHDSQAAIILQQTVAERTKAVLYDLKDAAYDAASIKAHSESLGSVPIIDANKRGGLTPPPMEPYKARLYKARSGAERVNSNLKDNYGGSTVRVRGARKVMCHLMFGVIAMSVEALARLY
jgi:Transposase domain (DUF772)/Transposase DDE domain